MLITKEQQEAWVDAYQKEHNTDECIGFIDGINKALGEVNKMSKTAINSSAFPDGWMDWNTLSLDQMVEHLRNKYMFSSSGDAKCIYHLIEFYDKHK